MAFVSVTFYIFVFAVALFYFLVPLRFRWIVLLAASYLYYWFNSRLLVFVLFGSTLVTFLFGLWLDSNSRRFRTFPSDISREEKKALKERGKKRGKRILTLGILADLGVLLFLKYSPFFGSNFNAVFGRFGVTVPISSFLLPLGISFYTLQALAYMLDVNSGKIEADRNLLKFMLFLSFFPQIVQGPIARHNQLAEQLYTGHRFEYRRVCYGLQLSLWGLMKKIILADRIAEPVACLFNNHSDFHGPVILLAGVLYGIQVYADFSGGMDIARGVAQIFGVKLELNFRQPYFSHSIEEFWRRWHITLGAWMRDYIFYPLSLSKSFSKLGKKSRKLFGSFIGKRLPAFLSMFIVYFLVGFWHGAQWKYVAYGLWNGIIIMSSLLLSGVYDRIRAFLRIDGASWSFEVFQILRTFLLCSIGRLFSQAYSFRTALAMLRSMFDRWYDLSFLVDGTLLKLDIDLANWFVVLVSLLVVFFVDYLHEKEVPIRESIAKQNILFRWFIYLTAIVLLAIFGMYGPAYDAGSFIYEQF